MIYIYVGTSNFDIFPLYGNKFVFRMSILAVSKERTYIHSGLIKTINFFFLFKNGFLVICFSHNYHYTHFTL